MLTKHDFSYQTETFLNQAPFSFDLSVMDLYLSLSTGSTLFSLTKKEIENPLQLHQSLVASGITIWVSTPSFAQLCLAKKTFKATLLFFCGEVLPHSLAQELLIRFPAVELWNTYGPTEATVAITSVLIEQDILDRYNPLPVGVPAPGSQIFLCLQDKTKKLLITEESGEIIIVGPNVSLGYLGKPDLTKHAFFIYEGYRAYRTGDRGHFRNGMLFFDGRVDAQFKLRGYRIEPGDIEYQLRSLPEIKEAIVTLIIRDSAPDFIAAYIVLKTRSTDTEIFQEIKTKLNKLLPSYMVPSVFVQLETMPLTLNGKINRQALPEPKLQTKVTKRKVRDTVTPIEYELRTIWEDLLQIKPIKINDNFFDLGGNSLLTVMLLEKIRLRWGKNLPLATLIHASTIESLAHIIIDKVSSISWCSLVPIQPKGDKTPFFCVHGVGGNIINLEPLARYFDTDQPFYALQSHGLNESKKWRPATFMKSGVFNLKVLIYWVVYPLEV